MAGSSHITLITQAEPVVAKASAKLQAQIEKELVKEEPKEPEKVIAKYTKTGKAQKKSDEDATPKD